MFALDTDTVSHFLRGEGRVAQRLLATDFARISLPAIVVHELRYGALHRGLGEQRLQDLESFLGCLAVLPFDDAAAAVSARMRVALERQGQQIGPFDLLIAGTVLASGATLVTRNQREFSRVPGLQIEDWY